jgi:hypothetical protein
MVHPPKIELRVKEKSNLTPDPSPKRGEGRQADSLSPLALGRGD